MSTPNRLEVLASSVATSTLASSFVDGLRSYQRSQLLLSGSNLPSETGSYSDSGSESDGSERFPDADVDDAASSNIGRREDSLLLGGEMSGDESDRNATTPNFPNLTGLRPVSPPARPIQYTRTGTDIYFGPPNMPPEDEMPSSERSPLLPTRVSFSTPPVVTPPIPHYLKGARRASQVSARIRGGFQGRHTSSFPPTGSSTFGQTLFNTIAALVGIGVLSEPLAFAYAGWLGGAALLTFYAIVACYTAILLANIMFSDSRVRTYADIGRKAFGRRAVPLISFLFCLELFSLSVVLVTLFADSLHAVVPMYSRSTYKLLSLLIIVPTALMPLSLLAYTSVIGILSTLLIIFVLLLDGFGKPDSPGSLLNPCSTQLLAGLSFARTGTAFGLFMAGFSGHAIVPSLARDMRDPTGFNTMIRWAFFASTLFYAAAGAAGYLMFGDLVSDEISQDLIATPEYPQFWNRTLMWMLVLMPISKYALGTRPLNTTFETFLGIDSVDQDTTPISSTFSKRALSRSTSAMASVIVSIAIPEFSSVMAFLGSFSAFTICIIGPILAHIKLNGARWWDTAILIVACVMAGWGTCAAFLP